MNSTIFIGIGGLVLALVFFLDIQGLPKAAKQLPEILIWIIAFLSVLMIIENKLKHNKTKEVKESLKAINWKEAIPFALSIITYVFIIPFLGYLLSTILFLIVNLITKTEIKRKTAVAYAIGLTLFVWGVFIYALKLPVPIWPTFL